MSFQLTISRRNLEPKDALKRKITLLVKGDKASIGGPEADCVLQGISGIAARIAALPDIGHTIMANAGSTVELNGKPCGQIPTKLHSGDRILVGPWAVQFYLCMEKAAQSWQSAVLANMVKAVCAIIILLIFGFMFLFTDLLRESDCWETYAAQNQLSQRLDDMRKNVRNIQKNNQTRQLDALLLEHIRSELDAQARHVRAYENAMSPAQRQDMLTSLEKLEHIIALIISQGVFKDLPQPAIDQALAEIITHKAR